jgi:HlyD family secretion protein
MNNQKGRKGMKTKWWIFLLFGLLGLVLVGCGQSNANADAPTSTPAVPIVTSGGAVVVEGNVVPRDFSRIYTRSGGKVAEVLVKEGDVVVEGTPLVRMDGQTQAEAVLSAAQLEQLSAQQTLDKLNEKAGLQAAQAQKALEEATRNLIEAQQKLDDYDTDQHQTDLDNAKTDVANAKDDLDDANDEWDKNKDLDVDNANRKNAETKQKDAQKKYDDAVRKRDRLDNDMNQYKAGVAAAQKAVDDAQNEVNKRKGDVPDPADLLLAQSRLANAEKQVKAGQTAIDDLVLKAPFAGTIVELDVAVGETMLPSQQVVLLADLSQLFVETSDLTEMDVVKVSQGQEASITPDALSEVSLPGSVDSIDQNSGKKGGDVTYTVRLKLTETDPALRWGMTVEVRFKK